jgi:hypothetical protein
MIENHPMAPPSEELKQWEDNWFDEEEHPDVLLIRAYQAGADAELEACCEWMASKPTSERKIPELRAARRPSLKQQAMEILHDLSNIDCTHYNILLRALEQLDD